MQIIRDLKHFTTSPFCAEEQVQGTGKSREDGRWKNIFRKSLLITSADFPFWLSNIVISIFSKDSHGEAGTTLTDQGLANVFYKDQRVTILDSAGHMVCVIVSALPS